MFKPEIASAEIPDFLMGHLGANLGQIAHHRGCSEDEAEALLHCVLVGLSGAANDGGRTHLTTKTGRAEWERAMSRNILGPAVNGMADAIKKMHSLEKESKKEAEEGAIDRVLQERGDPEAIAHMGPDQHPSLWQPRVAVDVANVATKVGEGDLRRKSPNFARFINQGSARTHEGALLDLVRLQEELARKYSRKFESGNLKKVTIRDFLSDEGFLSAPDREGREVERLVRSFIDTFNEARTDLFAWGAWGERAKEVCQVKTNFPNYFANSYLKNQFTGTGEDSKLGIPRQHNVPFPPSRRFLCQSAHPLPARVPQQPHPPLLGGLRPGGREAPQGRPEGPERGSGIVDCPIDDNVACCCDTRVGRMRRSETILNIKSTCLIGSLFSFR